VTYPESREEKTGKKRNQTRLRPRLEKNLWAYAAMASAAGVGMLASAPAAQAKIVYTPEHFVFLGAYALDLNHDGIVDFNLVPGKTANIAGSSRASYLSVCHIASRCVSASSSMEEPNKDNTVRISSGSGALALPAGAKIADGEKFQAPGLGALMVVRNYYSVSSSTKAQFWRGPWANGGKGSTNRYLGFKFKINGQFHYGWARLSVSTPAHGPYTATLTGYAYETTPNKGIVAGQKSGPVEIGDDVENMNPINSTLAANDSANAAYRPASLGLLGLGAAGIAIWRRGDDFLASDDQAKN
jgi:hypothetical protein